MTHIYVGANAIFEYSEPDYDSTYTATVVVRGKTVADLTATLVDGLWTATADATATASWIAGDHRIWLKFTKGSDVYTVEQPPIEIQADPTAYTNTSELRTANKIALDAIEALLNGRASDDAASISHNGRTLTKMGTDELTKLRRHYKMAVMAEKGQLTRFSKIKIG